MLEKTFLELTAHYTSDKTLVSKLWNEVETQYSSKYRHYHTLVHLENLLKVLTQVKAEIQDWNTILFSLFYHDIVYKARKSDNEAKSAEYAKQRMSALGVPQATVIQAYDQILATKGHNISPDRDTNLFTDADLSILGAEWASYVDYYENVRKEYALFPNLIYKRGRKKVLQHFLNMNRIFKTDYFFEQYEAKARANLSKELKVAI